MRVVVASHPQLPHEFSLAVHEDGDAFVSATIATTQCWEPFETTVFARLLSGYCEANGARPLVVDGGANLGWYTVVAGLLGADVLAAEPMPTNAELLQSNIDRNELTAAVEVFRGALGHHRDRAQLHVSSTNQGDHRLHAGESHDPAKRKATVEVAVETLDVLLGGRCAELIKLDTQGSEAAILMGATTSWGLGVGDDTTLLTEFWPYGLTRCGSSAEGLLSLLTPALRATHAGFVVLEDHAVLVPIDPSGIRAVSVSRALSPEVRGFVNLLVVPHRRRALVDDLIDHSRPLPFL
jgi:FkbM family methyltransferase